MGIKDLEKKYTAAKIEYEKKGEKLKTAKGRARGAATRSYNAAKRKYRKQGGLLRRERTNKLKKQKVTPAQARAHNNFNRSKAARDADRGKNAPIAKDARWKKNPEKFDYPGVDTKRKRK